MRDERHGSYSRFIWNASGFNKEGHSWLSACYNRVMQRTVLFLNAYTLLDPYKHSRTIATANFSHADLVHDVDQLRKADLVEAIPHEQNELSDRRLVEAYVRGCKELNERALSVGRGVERDDSLAYFTTQDGRPVAYDNP